jgi:aspartyl-tRNA(Asn)/glutamyl-tRNA(Gln) amidotransferase subunit A
VAGGEAFFALGTDTGGSIRQPASLSGVVGMKPTYGRVSRYGMVAFASSLDQCGPFTRSVADCAAVLSALAGHDPRDSTSVELPVPDYAAALTGDVRGLRLGVPREFFVQGMEPGVEAAVREAFGVLERLGAEIVEVSLPSTDAGLATYYIIAPAEASANLARYDGIRYGPSAGEDDLLDNYLRTRGDGFGAEVKRRIMLGTYALSAGYYDAYYVKAQQVRTLIKAEFDRVLADVDALLAPTSPSVAFKIGAKMQDPLLMYLNDACTLPVNIAGLPGISVPCGLSEGLPVGLQVIGRAFDEATVLRVADAFERVAGHSTLRPPTASD